jgi:hypothetical protein
MTEETAGMVRQIWKISNEITSLVADFHSVYNLQLLPIESSGKLKFLSTDRLRLEATINGKQIISIRKGSLVHRCLPQRNEIWKYDLNDLPQIEPINFGIADLRDPFFAVDELSLQYEGIQDIKGTSTYTFTANLRNWAKQGLLDTRKGFSLRYQPKGIELCLKLHIYRDSGLLRSIIGIDKTGKHMLQADYVIEAINVPLEDSLFAMNESYAQYKVLEISDILFSSLNPDAADAPPSIN